MQVSPNEFMQHIFSDVTGGDANVKRTDAQGLPMMRESTMVQDAQTNYDTRTTATDKQAMLEISKNEHAVLGVPRHQGHSTATQGETESSTGSFNISGKLSHIGSVAKSTLSSAAEQAKPSNAPISEKMGMKTPTLTSSHGWPLGDCTHSYNIGGYPVVSDGVIFEKQQTFNRSKIVERAVHACGSGGFGYFECITDMSAYTKSIMFTVPGKQIPLTARFSTVTYGKEYPDSARNPRGLAFKFYTEDGNYDILSVNFSVFFTRDPALGNLHLVNEICLVVFLR
jgi:hypothetical protein